MLETINTAVEAIRKRTNFAPRVGVVLGSGLGTVVDAIKSETVVPYGEIPGAKAATVIGHSGQMVFGHAGKLPVVLLSGRMHYYEGYEMQEVMLLSRIIGRLGIKTLIVTNAAGGVNTAFKAGDLMLISDHINLMGVNPLRGPNVDELGLRFPDMTEAYSEELRKLARDVAKKQGLNLQEGVYLALSGPTYETPAEIRAFRTLGADAVGMSTVPEVIAMSHMNIPVLGISLITNMAAGVLKQKLHHQEVMDTAARAANRFTALILGILERLG
jgi:purine-nucleoside phosphorylase